MENGQNKLVIVSSEVLPDIVLKVLAAKRMRARGEVSTSSEACRKVGISRSAHTTNTRTPYSIMKNSSQTTSFRYTAY